MVARASRGASLMRTSRMFSMPKPLTIQDLGLGNEKKSDTATTPYPLHLSIITSSSTRIIGDWGLKRPLPGKNLRTTSTPIVRIRHVDAIEAVTDFDSGAPHALSLEKFQEMHIPVFAPGLRTMSHKNAQVSVFEEDGDVTDLPKERNPKFSSKRWKFKGPWLASLTEPEFKKYMAKSVRPKKTEFVEFLRQRLADQLSQNANQKAIDEGNPRPEPRSASSVTGQELTSYIRYLRAARPLLLHLVGEFLDLAPAQPPTPQFDFAMATEQQGGLGNSIKGSSYNQGHGATPFSQNPYSAKGPPITHPSAGISYLRTAAYVENHPLYGPQKQHSPVNSRVLSPRRHQRDPKLGIGGFVVPVPPSMDSGRTFRSRWSNIDAGGEKSGLSRFDPSIRGGASAYLVPVGARAHHDGKIEVLTEIALPETQLVKKEQDGLAAIYLDKPGTEPQEEIKSEGEKLQHDMESAKAKARRAPVSSAANYGLSM